MAEHLPVSILGATGVVGQRFVRRLARHPNFRIAHLAASERNVGKRFREACIWRLDGDPYAGLGDEVLRSADPASAPASVVFSALDTEPAREIEPAFRAAGAHVFSNASTFRMTADVPLLIAEVNPGHLGLVGVQRRLQGVRGAIITNPNCTATILAMALSPLHEAFGVEAVIMTSMQAVSGAGYPGVPSLDILANVVPFIRNEEEKIEQEMPKLLGVLDGDVIIPAHLAISARCHRVPVLEGHTEAVSVRLRGKPPPAAVREVLAGWRPVPQQLGLPSAPALPIHIHDEADRPQARLDVETDRGMSVHVGRIRPCPVLGLKFALLGHNTERGAAGASILNAELAFARGLLT